MKALCRKHDFFCCCCFYWSAINFFVKKIRIVWENRDLNFLGEKSWFTFWLESCSPTSFSVWNRTFRTTIFVHFFFSGTVQSASSTARPPSSCCCGVCPTFWSSSSNASPSGVSSGGIRSTTWLTFRSGKCTEKNCFSPTYSFGVQITGVILYAIFYWFVGQWHNIHWYHKVCGDLIPFISGSWPLNIFIITHKSN